MHAVNVGKDSPTSSSLNIIQPADRTNLVVYLRQVFNFRRSAEVAVSLLLLIVIPAINTAAVSCLTDKSRTDAILMRTLSHDRLPAGPQTRFVRNDELVGRSCNYDLLASDARVVLKNDLAARTTMHDELKGAGMVADRQALDLRVVEDK